MSSKPEPSADIPDHNPGQNPDDAGPKRPTLAEEIGGRKGPEPTRYGDWEVNGICTDF